MEQEYLIGVTNKFAAFIDESEDPYDIIKNVEAEKLKKKSLKGVASNENKENKGKDAADQKAKVARKSTTGKPGERVLATDKTVKADNLPERAGNKRNRDEFGNNDGQRIGNKMEGAPRGPKSTDAPKGEKRDGPRPPRRDDDGRPRGPRQGNDGETRPFRQDRERQASGTEDRPPRRERREFVADGPDVDGRPDRRPARGRGGSRPFGAGRNYDNRGKREFDRKSGSDRTGVKAVDKRDGAGSFNWDSNKDVEVLVNDANVTGASDEADWDETIKDTDAPIDAAAPKEPDESAEEIVAPAEEEPQELTLAEYRERQGKRNLPQFDIRKPNEGEDLTQWKEMVAIKKKDHEEEADGEFETADYPQRVGRQRHVLGIDITFNNDFRGGRGRGGRGAGPGGRGGRQREPRIEGAQGEPQRRRQETGGSRQSAPKVDDKVAFPSLG